MKLFECHTCGQLVYFENTHCERCGATLGFDAERGTLLTLAAAGNDRWHPTGRPQQHYRFCANAAHAVCNWLVPADTADAFCPACQLNRTIPDLGQPEHLECWRRLEQAKHRLVYSLLRLHLPLVSRFKQPDTGLAFDFLADQSAEFRESPQVMTGHAEGLITINIAEADDAERERQRLTMAEPYRTLLGHFRHESGHYYWGLLARDTQWLESFHQQFGDEQRDYGQALDQHYRQGPPPDWQNRFVSAYASNHPWEDWAETWAHYLHIIDTLDTANAFGMRIKPRKGDKGTLSTLMDFDPYREDDIDHLVEAWLPLTFAMNSLNRSMGQTDLYPFILVPAVLEKLDFVHRSIRRIAVWPN